MFEIELVSNVVRKTFLARSEEEVNRLLVAMEKVLIQYNVAKRAMFVSKTGSNVIQMWR